MECSTCKLDKPEEDFYWRQPGKRRRGQCKECEKKYRSRYKKQAYVRKQSMEYWRNKPAVVASNNAKDTPCMDCGVQYPTCVMDFDHRPGEVKSFGIGQSKRSLEETLLEIAKCDVVCSNCHRLRTAARRGENIGEKKWTGEFGSFQLAKTHCPQGHEYTEENTYTRLNAKGKNRSCRECKKLSWRTGNCIDCKQPISGRATRCRSCANNTSGVYIPFRNRKKEEKIAIS